MTNRRQGQRVLYSAANAKRHDATTLETADGIMVAISGLSIALVHLKMAFHLSCAISSLPPLDKLPVPAARMRNLLMFSAGDSRKLVFNHMLQKLSSHDFKTHLLLSIQTREVNIRKYVLILLLMVKIQIAKRRLRLSRMIIIRRVQGVKQKRNPRRRIS
ncbi:uncharacterized protein LOC120152101 [Hibiscus syriacus]|uniref:uncharacterized protein LOC120152101 n=1 Tax=Hibiscus syriacus TaxID=106335 RepID=UPI001924D0D3|nr:uncharacterized protein LOC120152101 [Hibiscus syriacus]